MKNILLAIIVISLVLPVAACSGAPQAESTATPTVSTDTPVPSVPASVTPSPTPQPSPTVTPTSTVPPPSKPSYVISAQLDYAYRHLSVEEALTIPNPSDEPIPELVLVVQPNNYPGVFTLREIVWGDGNSVEAYTLQGIRLRIPLDEPLAPRDERTLSLRYELQMPPLVQSEEVGPTPFGYTTRQINLVDWYPFVPPYQPGEGWVVHNPWYYGEHLVFPVADFDIALTLKNAPNGTMVAASSLDQGDGETHRYHLENGRNFVFSVSPSYHRYEQQVGDTTVLGYVFGQYQSPGVAAFDATVESFELYSELFGPYEQPSLTMVQGDFLHDMEYQGLHFLSRGFFNTYDDKMGSFLITIAAHETAHQWWYGIVGNNQALEPWLDEALATYSERLFYEHLYPDALTWWTEQRVHFYQPSGWVDSALHYTDGYRPYRDAVYLRGALFLHDLRAVIGDEAFFAFLKDYTATYRYQLVDREDFFNTLSKHSQADLNDLLAIYFQE